VCSDIESDHDLITAKLRSLMPDCVVDGGLLGLQTRLRERFFCEGYRGADSKSRPLAPSPESALSLSTMPWYLNAGFHTYSGYHYDAMPTGRMHHGDLHDVSRRYSMCCAADVLLLKCCVAVLLCCY
jgi:hypothetical protein